jgi:hypothetical protein
MKLYCIEHAMEWDIPEPHAWSYGAEPRQQVERSPAAILPVFEELPSTHPCHQPCGSPSSVGNWGAGMSLDIVEATVSPT